MMKFLRRKERQEKRSSMPVLRGNGNGAGATTQITVVSADGWDKGDASTTKKAKLPLTRSQTMKPTSGKKV